MKKKLSNYIFTPISAILLLIAVIFFVIGFIPFGYKSNIIDNNINAIFFGIGTNIIGIIITISFVQYYFDLSLDKKNKDWECSCIKNEYRILKYYIEKYIRLFNSTISTDEVDIDSNKICVDFSFSSLSNIYSYAMFVNEPIGQSVIESFYRLKDEFDNKIYLFYVNNKLLFYPDLCEAVQRYLECAHEFDEWDAIIKAKQIKIDKETLADIAIRMIKENKKNYVELFHNGSNEINGNIMILYVTLYEHLRNLATSFSELEVQFENIE